MTHSDSGSSVQEQNAVNQSDLDFVNQSLNIFGRQTTSVSQPNLAIGSTIVPQRFANLDNQQGSVAPPSRRYSAGSRVPPVQQSTPVPQYNPNEQYHQPDNQPSQYPQPTEQQQEMQTPRVSISVKIPEPKPFTGERKDARTWLSGLDRYFRACGWNVQHNDDQMHAVTQALMQGAASRWLDRLTKLNQLPTSYEDFKQIFLSQFCVLDDENVARDRLKEARQKTNVASYIAYFDNIILDLPNAQEEDLIHNFIYGLKYPIKGLVKGQIAGQTVSLSDVMLLALQYEESNRTDHPTTKSHFQKHRHHSTRTGNQATPMELGNMQIRDKSKVRCYNCNLLGHYAKDCRKPKKRYNPAQQRVNNITVEAGGEAVPADSTISTARMPKN